MCLQLLLGQNGLFLKGVFSEGWVVVGVMGGCQGGNLARFSAAMAPFLDAQRYEKIRNKSHAQNLLNLLQLSSLLSKKNMFDSFFAMLS